MPCRPGSRFESSPAGPFFSQKEVAAILRISERAVREIEKTALEKLRRNPVLQGIWREYEIGEIKEAAFQASNQWVLSRAEIAAIYALARTPSERQAVKKLITIVQRAS